MFFGAEGVVAEREEANGGRLICVECFWEDGPLCVVLLLGQFAAAKTGADLTYGYEVWSAFPVTVDIAHWVADVSRGMISVARCVIKGRRKLCAATSNCS